MGASSLDVAVAQLPHSFGDPEAQLAHLDEVLAKLDGVDLVLLPETCITGYVSPRADFDLSEFAEPLDGATRSRLAELAREHEIAIAGPVIERDGDRLFNSLVLLDAKGELRGHWRKRHPWHPETWATPGDLGTPVVTLGDVRITAGICFDLHFLAYDAAAELAQADLLLFPSAWVEKSPDTRQGRLAALARRFDIAVMSANWGRGRPVCPGMGFSVILDARGEVVAAATTDGEELVRARLAFPAHMPAHPPGQSVEVP